MANGEGGEGEQKSAVAGRSNLWQQITDLFNREGKDPREVKIKDLDQEIADAGAKEIEKKEKPL